MHLPVQEVKATTATSFPSWSNETAPGCPLTCAGRADIPNGWSRRPGRGSAGPPAHGRRWVRGWPGPRRRRRRRNHVRREHADELLDVTAADRGQEPVGSSAPCRRDASKRGRPSSIRRRARPKICGGSWARFCLRSGQPRRIRSRTPRAAGTRPVPPATGSPAAPGTPATGSQPSRRVGGARPGIGHERFRQPGPDVGLAPDPRRPQVVDRQPAWSWWPGTPGVIGARCPDSSAR